MNSFFASWTFFVIFAVCTLSNQMRSQGADLDSLSALSADREHRASVKIMHIFVVLFNEAFIHSFTKLAHLIFIGKIG